MSGILRKIVKAPGSLAAGSTVIPGFQTNRYNVGSVGDKGYGVVPKNSYQSGDTLVFTQCPSKKIVSVSLISFDNTPVSLTVGPQISATATASGTVTGFTTGAVFTSTNNNLIVGNPVVFSSIGSATGTTPVIGTTYYVIAVAAATGTFTLSATQGGSALALSSNTSLSTAAVFTAPPATFSYTTTGNGVGFSYRIDYDDTFSGNHASEVNVYMVN